MRLSACGCCCDVCPDFRENNERCGEGETTHGSAIMTMCGYRCDLCKAFVRNIEKRDQRSELSAMWKKYYDIDIMPEHILCDGCNCMKPDARRVDAGCRVRPCVMEKGLSHCGECPEYPCATWQERKGLSVGEARERLGDSFNEVEFKEYIEAYDNATRIALYIKSRK